MLDIRIRYCRNNCCSFKYISLRKQIINSASMKKKDPNNILFARNNIIFDTVEKMTNSPFVFADEELEDYSILKNNKEIALVYTSMILISITYIIICDFLGKDDN